ncbi:MAG: acyl-[acyl-carrier-protein]--UDP-N-acetylglucosamine O-acyltransferase [Myxococcota bacterium]|nr:acyl-[acyl-carrier-protein]--UDP-N-acetylglucosamine O-acyltransferase [Myxococcota bacterium]
MSAVLEPLLPLQVDPLARVLGEVDLSPPATVSAGAVLRGPLRAGAGLTVHPGASLGGPAQHRLGGAGAIEIGREVEVWEGATIHRGSAAGCGTTRIGDRVMVMAYAHVGHDVQVGDEAVLSNGVQIGGHVHVDSKAVLGARAAIHQFVRIGRGAMVAAGALVSGDVPPWSLVAGDRARIVGANRVALGDAERIDRVRRGLRRMAVPGTRGCDLLKELGGEHSEVRDLAAFLDAPSKRGICRWGRRS